MAVVKLNELSKRYTATAAPAVDNADLTIEDGEFGTQGQPMGSSSSYMSPAIRRTTRSLA